MKYKVLTKKVVVLKVLKYKYLWKYLSKINGLFNRHMSTGRLPSLHFHIARGLLTPHSLKKSWITNFLQVFLSMQLIKKNNSKTLRFKNHEIIKSFIILAVLRQSVRVTSWRGPSPRHCTGATQLLSKKCRSGGELLATLCSIWPARDLNLRPPAPETNALLLDQVAGIKPCGI